MKATMNLRIDFAELQKEIAELGAALSAHDEELNAVHRRLAAETLRADQGWQRYEAANNAHLALQSKYAALSAQQGAAGGVMSAAETVEQVKDLMARAATSIPASLATERPSLLTPIQVAWIVGMMLKHEAAYMGQHPPAAATVEAGKLRAEGRAEAMAILMELCAENGIDDYTQWVPPVGMEDEGSIRWNEAKLRELFHVDGELSSLRDKAKAAYWEYIGYRDEAKRAQNFAANLNNSGAVRAALAKHGEYDLMATLCTTPPQADEGRDAVDAKAKRWDFMMRVADNPEGPEAKALEEAADKLVEEERSESAQMNDAVDAAIAAIQAKEARK